MQGALYGIVVCGIRNLRVWTGPLPEWICLTHVKMTQMMFTFASVLIVLITITRFMFICVWRSMRQMNDNLLVMVAISQIILLSFLHCWPIDGHLGIKLIFKLFTYILFSSLKSKGGLRITFSVLLQTDSNFNIF